MNKKNLNLTPLSSPSLSLVPSLSFSPCGKKFRSKPQIARFLGESADLTCFDFSRAGSPGDGTQRRRARDRSQLTPGGGGGGGALGSSSSSTGNIVTRRSEPRSGASSAKPLSTNPLRPSGPVRRTCGVIKLPVIWVAPPNNDQIRDDVIILDQKREVALHLIVQTLWERRLFGFKPCDHATGYDIAAHRLQNGTAEAETKKPSPLLTSKPHSPQSSSLSHVSAPFLTFSSLASSQSQAAVTPLHPAVSTNGLMANQQQTHPSTQNLVPNGTSAQTVELSLPLVTESVLRAQEERVRLIRQQLLAAQSISS